MSINPIGLDVGEELVTVSDEIILRQIISPWQDERGTIVSLAFGHSPADKLKPLYSRSSKVSAQESRNWHCELGRSMSVAVYGLSVEEASVSPTRVIDDCNVKSTDAKAPGHR